MHSTPLHLHVFYFYYRRRNVIFKLFFLARLFLFLFKRPTMLCYKFSRAIVSIFFSAAGFLLCGLFRAFFRSCFREVFSFFRFASVPTLLWVKDASPSSLRETKNVIIGESIFSLHFSPLPWRKLSSRPSNPGSPPPSFFNISLYILKRAGNKRFSFAFYPEPAPSPLSHLLAFE